MFSSLQPRPGFKEHIVVQGEMGIAPQCEHVTCCTGPSSSVCTSFWAVCLLWQYVKYLNSLDCVCVGFCRVGFFSSLTFLLLLAVLSCCLTVSLNINYMIFSLSLPSSSPTVTITAAWSFLARILPLQLQPSKKPNNNPPPKTQTPTKNPPKKPPKP